MRPPWDSERSAGFDFASLKQKKIRRSRIRRIVRLTDCLGAFAGIKVWQWGAGRACFFASPLKLALGRWYESYRLENRLGRSQSLRDGSCIDGFAARLTIQRQRRQPRHRRTFLSFCNSLVFNSYFDKIRFEWSTLASPQAYYRPTVLFSPTFGSPGARGGEHVRLS